MQVLTITWLLVASIIVYAYTSTLISYLSVNYKRPEITTFQDLGTNNNYEFQVLKGSIAEIDILASLLAF